MLTISTGSGWNDTSRGTRVPTEIAKLTLVTGRMFCSLITVLILVRCSVESFAPPAACPVVWDLPSAPFVSAFMLPLRSSRPSAFMLPSRPSALVPVRSSRPSALRSLAPLALSFSELMLFDFSPFMSLSWADFSPFGAALMSSCACCLLAAVGGCSDCVALAPGAGFVGFSDCVGFTPDDGLAGSAASRAAGAACSDGCGADAAGRRRRRLAAPPLRAGEPGTGDQRRRGHRHHKTISHGTSPHVFALPAPTTR